VAAPVPDTPGENDPADENDPVVAVDAVVAPAAPRPLVAMLAALPAALGPAPAAVAGELVFPGLLGACPSGEQLATNAMTTIFNNPMNTR
jgi:hypothetical protein